VAVINNVVVHLIELKILILLAYFDISKYATGTMVPVVNIFRFITGFSDVDFLVYYSSSMFFDNNTTVVVCLKAVVQYYRNKS
jgi:hypothetical protein